MNENLTEIVVILDRSGSMAGLAKDTIGGFNSFLEKQKLLKGEAKLTLILFDDSYEVCDNAVDIKLVSPLTDSAYFARGMTALNDAVGKTINTIGERLKNTKESERPGKVIFLITTDGQENSSKEFKASQIKEMVKRQQETYNWEFVFLGANIDSFAEGDKMGYSLNSTANYEPSVKGMEALYSALSRSVTDTRNGVTEKMSMGDYMKEEEKN